MRILCAIAVLAAGLGSVAACEGAGEQRLNPADTHKVDLYARLGPIKMAQPFGFELFVCGDGRSASQRVDVDAWMPAHQHGMNYTPTVTQRGANAFDVTNMVFHMPGAWQIKVSVETDAGRELHLLDIRVK